MHLFPQEWKSTIIKHAGFDINFATRGYFPEIFQKFHCVRGLINIF